MIKHTETGSGTRFRYPLSRRGFLAAAGFATAFAALGLAGCEYDPNDPLGIKDDGGEGSGFDADAVDPAGTDVKLVAWVDSYICKMGDANETNLENFLARYNSNEGRENVTLDVRQAPTDELRRAAAAGSLKGDVLLCDAVTMDAALESGIVHGGLAETSVRWLNQEFPSSIMLAVPKGSKLKMPKADTASGEDATDGSTTQFRNLAKIKGRLAIAGDGTLAGMAARSALYKQGCGLYSVVEGIGGEFDPSLDSILVHVESDEDVFEAVKSGKVDAGFVLGWDYRRNKGLDMIWSTPTAIPRIEGASIEGSENGGIARDFLAFVSQCS